MKISREWLQTYFEKPLPEAQALADALTFHAFEIESITTYDVVMPLDSVLDVKITPNRGHDCLSHRGIAKELSAILNVPMKADSLHGGDTISIIPKTNAVKVHVEDSKLCPRFTGALIQGIKVGPSPEWLRVALESVGQKSINNIVDATNYIMFDIGQPLHAFDVSKIKDHKLEVKRTKKEEQFVALDDKGYALPKGTLVIADNEHALSIAGIKGSKPTGIDEATTDIFLEAANWDGVTIRKTSQTLKLRTDASDRFQQVISPELAVYGLRAAADLIVELAGGKIVDFVDEYPKSQEKRTVSVSTEKVNKVLGTKLADADVADVFTRLDLLFMQKGSEFTVDVPFERLDLVIPEDLIEEVARIVGYDKISATELPKFSRKPEVNPSFYAAEKAREELVAKGYSEVFTSVFAEEGERAVLNKVGGEKPYLRTTLVDGLKEACERNTRNRDLLGLKEVKLFEIGAVWKNGKEVVMLGTADSQGVRETTLPISGDTISRYEELPTSVTEHYQPFSRYPSITRDVSLWVPVKTDPEEVLALIREGAGELLVHSELFDTFAKGEKQSLAFRLVFQSFDRTLTDDDASTRMESVYVALKHKGFEIR